MKINRNNYEAFFLDYIEGKLKSAEIAVLMSFLDSNPDLRAELDNYEAISLPLSNSIFAEKEFLKKDISNVLNINDSNFDEFCIARLEGDMDSQTEMLFENYLQQNPGKLREYKLYLKTILEPDKTVVFDEKRRLKHFSIIRPRTSIFITLAAAASIAILFMVYMFQNNNRNKTNEFVTNDSNTKDPFVIAVNEPILLKKNLIKQKIQADDKKSTIIEQHVIAEKTVNNNRDAFIPLEFQKSASINELSPSMILEGPSLASVNNKNIFRKETIAKKDKYLTINEYAKEGVIKVLEDSKIVDNSGLNLWSLAKSGLAQINKLTGSNIELNKEQDTTGNRIRIEFNTGLLGYYTSKNE
jgi:hypothetical protein